MTGPRSWWLRAALAAIAFVGSASVVAQQAPLAEGSIAPDFVSIDGAGKEVRLSDHRGKVVVLDFWATWCVPCQQAMPHLDGLARRHAADVVVLAVCTSDSRARFEDWVKTKAAQFPGLLVACDPHDRGSATFEQRASAKDYHVGALPTTFVVDRGGKVTATIVGHEDGDVRLEAGLARAGIAIDAAVRERGEQQLRAAAEKAAKEAAAAAANEAPSFYAHWFGLAHGQAMPELPLVGTDGQPFALASLRGKPFVLSLAWHEIVPKAKLAEVAAFGRDYGVEVVAVFVNTTRADFDAWIRQHGADAGFRCAHDPAARFEGDAKADPEGRMAHHRASVTGRLFRGMYPAMPVQIVVDGEGRFLGGLPLGPKWREGLGNLLLRAGVDLRPEHRPTVVAPPEAWLPKPAAPRPAEEPVALRAVGTEAPDFAALDLGNRTVRLADHRGKVVVLDFWATWCGPCKQSFPHVQELAKRYADQGVVVIASCTSDERKAFESWVQQHGGDYPDLVFAHDPSERKPERASRRLYGVSGIPQSFVIDRQGKVVAEVGGYSPGEVLLDAALAAAGIAVEPAVLEQAAADRKRREERSKPAAPGVKMLPLGK